MPRWFDSIRKAIADNLLNSEQNFDTFTVTQSGNDLVGNCTPWTIDLNNPVHNGEQRSFSFNRTKGTIARKKSGLHKNQLIGGTGTRQNLMWSNAVWPNIADLHVRKDGSLLGHGTHTIPIGTTLELRYVALDYDSSSTVTLHVDSDRNPYNNNDFGSRGDPIQHPATNEIFIEKSVHWKTTGMSDGTTTYI